MKYRNLRHLMEVLVRKQSCLRCGTTLDMENIEVLAVFGDRVVLTSECSCSPSVHIMISEKVSGSAASRDSHQLRSITGDEFLSMRERIEKTDGGISSLFS